jgi:signal transduction histidine kinase
MPFLRGWPIRNLFLAVALASLAPLLAGELAHTILLMHEDRALAENLTHEAARAIAGNIGRLVEDSRAQVAHVALKPALTGRDREPADEVLHEMLDFQPRYAGAALLAADGRVLDAVSRRAEQPQVAAAQPAIVEGIRAARTTFLSEPILGRVSRRWVCVIAARIPPAPASRAAYVSASLDLVKVGDLLSSFETEREATITIVSREGHVVARVPASSAVIGGDISATPLGRLVAGQRDGRATARGLDGRRRLFGYSPIPAAGWMAIVGVPQNSVAAGLRTRLLVRLAILATGLAAGIALAAIASRAVARPIGALELATDALARGQAGASVPMEGPREIRAVGKSFNRMVQTLRRTERTSALGGVVAGLAHEIRGPLFGLKGLVEAWGARSQDRASVERYLPHVEREVDRINRLVNDLLDYGRDHELTIEPVPVLAVLEEAVRAERAAAAERGVEIALTFAGAPGTLQVDHARAIDLFANLVDNAVRHSPAGTTVELASRVAEAGAWIEVDVLDRGPGIAEDDLLHVFEPFFSRREGGTGVGLALVRRLVEDHGGTIAAANRPDGGARFTVRLPGAPS